ncbi:MAG: hypothetical protein QOG19_3112 [Mycobacterium sp.]|jgi:hypothetical protein|nr:hypothetical protein [Mycobacterium sp.]
MNLTDEPTTTPLQLDITAIDLALISDDNGDEFVICRMIDGTGLIFDVPMARGQAEAFGNSLAEYASAAHVPAWR